MMTHCCFCDQSLTQEIRRGHLTLWCRYCWQEISDLEAILLKTSEPVKKAPIKSLVSAA